MSTKACDLVAVMWRCIMVCKVFWNRSTMLAFMSSFSLVKKWMALLRSTLWKAVALISDPLSLWTARGDLSIYFSMSSMAAAVSVPRLLWRVLTQAYLEKTSIQQNRNLVPSLCFLYVLQSTKSHCSCCPGPATTVGLLGNLYRMGLCRV